MGRNRQEEAPAPRLRRAGAVLGAGVLLLAVAALGVDAWLHRDGEPRLSITNRGDEVVQVRRIHYARRQVAGFALGPGEEKRLPLRRGAGGPVRAELAWPGSAARSVELVEAEALTSAARVDLWLLNGGRWMVKCCGP